MLISIIFNYLFGILIDKINNTKIRKLVFILSLLFNILLLAYFKYFNFLLKNINNLFKINLVNKKIVLPIGISFYTFQIISYIVDLYKKEIKVQKNLFHFALYVSFFPQLIAGPIVKYKDISEQIKTRKITLDSFIYGTKRFIYGLSKKVIFANSFALLADTIFDYNIYGISTYLAWIGSIAYTLQIYFDFSGYSDMAIGLGKMFGFTFKENFNLPYTANSITDF